MKTMYSKLKSITVSCLLIIGLVHSGSSYAVHPCVDITKEVSADGGVTWHDANTEAEAVSITTDALYKLTVKRCDLDGLVNVQLTDGVLNLSQAIEDFPFIGEWDSSTGEWVGLPDLEAEAKVITVNAVNVCDGYTGTLLNTVTVTANGQFRIEDLVSDSDDAWIRCEPPAVGGEGCTPGYWKQEHHYDSWTFPLTRDTLFSAVFDRVITIKARGGAITDPTLIQALSALGGKINTAARHSTAAYLNAISVDVSYDLTGDQVIQSFQAAYDSNDFGLAIEKFVELNEQGCLLN